MEKNLPQRFKRAKIIRGWKIAMVPKEATIQN